jgi:hypothetical protein
MGRRGEHSLKPTAKQRAACRQRAGYSGALFDLRLLSYVNGPFPKPINATRSARTGP